MAKTKTKDAARLSMACPFCDKPAMVKACHPGIRGAKGQDWYWRCECGARGFFPHAHYQVLDRHKKISIASNG